MRWIMLLTLVMAVISTTARADGDAISGEKVFMKCRACHQLGEAAKNGVGPELNGIVGRHSGAAPDYKYSEANKNSGIIWDEANLREFLTNPKAKVPGTKMGFPGIKDEKALDDLLAYLKQYSADGKKS